MTELQNLSSKYQNQRSSETWLHWLLEVVILRRNGFPLSSHLDSNLGMCYRAPRTVGSR